MTDGWQWDETLFAGSAAHYVVGRMPYPPELAQRIVAEVGVQGGGRALDVGCGPGSLTLLLAPSVGEAVGIDADPEMIEQAAGVARRAGVSNVVWRRMRAEELPGELGAFDLVTFAQSFHWMQRLAVATAVRGMLTPGGACVHVHATTHRGDASSDPLPRPRPPHAEIETLITAYLGPGRRAGRATVFGPTPSGEDAIYREAGFAGPRHVELRRGEIVERSVDDVVAATFSLSRATPHLFGDRRAPFEADLRALLRAASDEGRFSERLRDIAFDVWRPNGA